MPPGSCSSPSMQQGPPPPYAPKPPTPASGSKLQKAGMPEKYDKLNKSGSSSPHPGGGNLQLLDSSSGGGGDMFKSGPGGPGSSSITSSGLQTTPSPQLMNYIEFEGQELTITKQVNASYKGPADELMLDQKPPLSQQQQQMLPPPPNNQNSAILNCLNSNNSNTTTPVTQQQQQPPGGDEIKNELLDAQLANEQQLNFGGPNTNNTSSPLGSTLSFLLYNALFFMKYTS